ncbi:hypothetical protein [Limnohabitans sp. Rim28]|uniref:hypothetical protein n=1 Tax=Limnohabitans sp. Rim28 TaxID=1100720 RepID=UPI001EDD925E|nr:hypothetical protein [Limnohabitans sp. Rim28]
MEKKMGRGLIRLYVALWAIWVCYGVLANYRELATYLGSDEWTFEKAAEKETVRWNKECKGKPLSANCPPEDWVPLKDVVSEDQVKNAINGFGTVMFVAPFFFLLLLVIFYWLVKWVIAGFRRKK